MIDWVCSTVDLVRSRSDVFLIIRAHPGENRLKFKTRTPVRQFVMERFPGELPSNVRLVDGPSEFSSYEIARQSDTCAVYTSTLGIELSLMGLRPLICGVPFYSNKGFTNDICTRAEYFDFLGGSRRPAEPDLELLPQVHASRRVQPRQATGVLCGNPHRPAMPSDPHRDVQGIPRRYAGLQQHRRLDPGEPELHPPGTEELIVPPLRIAQLASFRGNLGDNANVVGTRLLLRRNLRREIAFTNLEYLGVRARSALGRAAF